MIAGYWWVCVVFCANSCWTFWPVDKDPCSFTGFSQLSRFSIVCFTKSVQHFGMLYYQKCSTAYFAEGGPGWARFTASFTRLLDCSMVDELLSRTAVRAVQTGRAIAMQEFTADLKHIMKGVWRDTELVDPNTHNNKLADPSFMVC